MSLSARFNEDLWKRLKEKIPSYEWRPERRIGGPTKERVDVGGEPKKTHGRRPTVLVEAELRREDPASNILKLWNRLVAGAYPSGVVLIQGFSKVYRSPKHHTRGVRYRSAKRFAKLVQRNFKNTFSYFPVNIPYHPRAGSNEGDGARIRWARWFADRVAARCRKLGLTR